MSDAKRMRSYSPEHVRTELLEDRLLPALPQLMGVGPVEETDLHVHRG